MIAAHEMNASRSTAMMPPLREEVGEALDRLSRMLVQRVPDPLQAEGDARAAPDDVARVQDAVRFLGQVASGWQDVPEAALLDDAAGFGSTVEVEDVDTGERHAYTLMAGAMLDFDAGQVSLASPIGQALIGTRSGVVVRVDTPQRRRTLRVLSVLTLRERLQQEIGVA